jgi:hypothetical protein
VRANRRRLLAVKSLQCPDDFFGRELTATLSRVQISVSDDIVHRKDSLRHTLLVHYRKAADLFAAMVCRASWISSSGLHVTTFLEAISPTVSSPAPSGFWFP